MDGTDRLWDLWAKASAVNPDGFRAKMAPWLWGSAKSKTPCSSQGGAQHDSFAAFSRAAPQRFAAGGKQPVDQPWTLPTITSVSFSRPERNVPSLKPI
jgi:hypothetical protein